MSDLKNFLRVLTVYGYPNEKLTSIANLAGYDLDYFLKDLEKGLGRDGIYSFVRNALNKIIGKDGVRVDISPGEYVYVFVDNEYYDREDSYDSVIADFSWGESKIILFLENGTEVIKTMKEIENELDMGDWGDYEDLKDTILDKFNKIVFENCGFYVNPR